MPDEPPSPGPEAGGGGEPFEDEAPPSAIEFATFLRLASRLSPPQLKRLIAAVRAAARPDPPGRP